jgi:hypothetical protein
MRLGSGCALLAVLSLFAACGGSGSSGTKIGGMVSDGGDQTPGDEAGVPGRRGGGGGAFGGGEDDGGASSSDAAPMVPPDARPDLALADRPTKPDVSMPSPDLAPPAPDATGTNICNDGTCNTFETEYAAALTRARSCSVNVKAQCSAKVSSSLRCAGCESWVNSTVELDQIRAQWAATGCAKCAAPCPAIACRALSTGVCNAKRLAAPGPGDIVVPPAMLGTCADMNDPVLF